MEISVYDWVYVVVRNIEIIIGFTTMNEQNEKSYYCTKSYKDMVLYPDEKASMLFELTNF